MRRLPHGELLIPRNLTTARFATRESDAGTDYSLVARLPPVV